PQEGQREPWWPLLLSRDETQPRVIARLPFGAAGNARGTVPEALVIGRVALEPTGRDCSLFAIEAGGEISRSGLRDALASVSMPPLSVQFWRDPNDAATRLHLIEVDGCIRHDDARFVKLAKQRNDISRVWALGGYAAPLTAAELDPKTAD
ncbi:MAG: chorismate mutase, partial [Dongiaceae bacterium]